jgi:hypothetical protein
VIAVKQSQVKMHFFIVLFPFLFVCGIHFPVGPNEEGGRNGAATNQVLLCSKEKKERLA